MKRRRWTAWVASLAILLSALAPALSHAFAGVRLNPLHAEFLDRLAQAETCHTATDGTDATEAPKAQVAPAPVKHGQHDPLTAMEHCPFCLAHAAGHGLPPPTQSFGLIAPTAAQCLPDDTVARLTRDPAWRLALSRAPPFFL